MKLEVVRVDEVIARLDADRFLTLLEATELLSVSKPTFLKAIAKRPLRTYFILDRERFKRSELISWMEQSANTPAMKLDLDRLAEEFLRQHSRAPKRN